MTDENFTWLCPPQKPPEGVAPPALDGSDEARPRPAAASPDEAKAPAAEAKKEPRKRSPKPSQ